MRYEKVCKGKFIARPNRFIAEVELEGRRERAHVKNTGRLRELLLPGAEIIVEDHINKMGTRKLRYSLIGVKKNGVYINIDSQAPNKVCEEALHAGTLQLPGMGVLTKVKREQTFGASRFDFYVEDENGLCGWIEVKGVTLEVDGIAKFPDAPTERGVKHVEELMHAAREGYQSYILFVIQMPEIQSFAPNDDTHKAFGDALRHAEVAGVQLLASTCVVAPDQLELHTLVPVKLHLE